MVWAKLSCLESMTQLNKAIATFSFHSVPEVHHVQFHFKRKDGLTDQ